jgi:hypothetical protein
MAASIKITALWVIVPCILVEADRHFRRAYCLHHQGDIACLANLVIGTVTLEDRRVKAWKSPLVIV